MNEEPKNYQEKPTQDSGLQTPQPDQPHPPVRRDDLPEDSPPVDPNSPDESSDQPTVESDTPEDN